MPDQNLSAILYKRNDIRLEYRPIPEPKDDEVLLKIGSVGICGSDLHTLRTGGSGEYAIKQPTVIGHEASGTVVKVGANVKNLKIGDRVAIEPGVPCRQCSFCKEGRYNLCTESIYCVTPSVHGYMARYCTQAADFCFKLPDHVSLDEGAFMEPLAVAVHACTRGGVKLGSVVLVLGTGAIGLVVTSIAKCMGATKIICVDLIESRLKIAKDCGADYTLQIKPNDDDDSIAKAIEETLGEKPNITMDCGGFQSTVNIALQATRSGGVMVLLGMGASEVTIPATRVTIGEIDIRGNFRYCNDYPRALAMLASGKVNVKPLITHHFKLEDTLEAFETALKGIGNPIKVMVHCN